MTLWTIGYEKLWPDALKLAEHGIAYEHRRELLLEGRPGWWWWICEAFAGL